MKYIVAILKWDCLTSQGPDGYNVSTLNFQWQILVRVKQISYFIK